MFPAWRLQLREARLAVADGRWDEAAEMLASDSLKEFLPAKRLSVQLAGQLVQRARQRLETGQSTAGWRDLDRAARLGVGEDEIGGFRHEQANERLRQAIDLLARGDATAARQALDRMDQRRLGGQDRRTWQAIATHVENADIEARKGDLGAAVESLEHAQRLLPAEGSVAVADRLEHRLASLREKAARQHALDARLHAALAAADWTEVLAAADALLELAPQHSPARQARHKAWQAVGMEVTRVHRPSPRYTGERLGEGHRANGWHDQLRNPSPSPSAPRPLVDLRGREVGVMGMRIVAWIDEVGAFMVCLGDEIVLGQPSADGGVDVPILGDISRRHAVIRREREAYVLTPLQRTMLDGRVITDPTVLRDKATIKLGDAVELRFRKPHALSATAVLEIASHHRTEPAVDGVILMSESCILGPQGHSHIRCRDWTGELVLFRRGEELMCRTHSPVEIDGQTCVGQAAVAGDCRIESDDFALSLEEI